MGAFGMISALNQGLNISKTMKKLMREDGEKANGKKGA
jgi:hypothetical protein